MVAPLAVDIQLPLILYNMEERGRRRLKEGGQAARYDKRVGLRSGTGTV